MANEEYVPTYDEEFSSRLNHIIPNNPSTLVVEPGRMRRAMKLWCIQAEGHQYVVQGSREPMYVDLAGETVCYCEDMLRRELGTEIERRMVCKHILRVLLARGHPKVVAMAEWLKAHDDVQNERATRGH